MKIILKTIYLFFLTQCYGQIIPIENMEGNIDLSKENKPYYKDVNGVLNKFLGTWKYQSNNELFEITFIKVEKYIGGNYDKDRLTSRFKYIEDGELVYNTYPSNTSGRDGTPVALDPSADYYAFGGIIRNTNLNKIELEYDEPGITLNGSYPQQLILTYNPDTGKSHWKIKAPSVIRNGEEVYPYRVPSDMILTKVN